MAELKKFLKGVSPDIRMAPAVVMENAVLSAAIEFCSRAPVWLVENTQIYIPAGFQTGRAPRVAAQSVIDHYIEIRRDGGVLRPGVSYDVLPDRNIKLTSELEEDVILTAIVALKPTRDATQLPDILFNQYYEAITHGARARLLAQTNQEWGDPQASDYHRRIFEGEVGQFRVDQTAKGGSGGLFVRPRRVF